VPRGKDGRVTNAEHLDIAISTETIRLGQLLKLANVIDSGSDAKMLLAEGGVSVNGEMETRRGRQLRVGDVIQLDDIVIRVTNTE